ncbi:hypothetical protein [Planococcus halocryophilus]|uniref:hypothetical protein n=1 Tax=Planococcus halocryophilus TaxID=1215089 RepID=UPI001F1010A9|nr:hypothetical protein [Planococcus halocryophilus]MCH4825890.1 hypothetical protein [Planococcus halocryophilus]
MQNGIDDKWDYDFYNNPDSWIAGFYELSIEYHLAGNDKRLNDALVALTENHYFKGLWKGKRGFQKPPVSLPIAFEEVSVRSFYGTISLLYSTKKELPCLETITRINGKSDWLDISIPQAALEKAFPYRYPLTTDKNKQSMKHMNG